MAQEGAAGQEAIEPSEFDLVVIGTGLVESIVAAAAAKAGRSVLQLDPSNQYGGSWASLRLNEFADLLQSGGGNGTADGPANGAASEAAAVAAEAASSGSDSAEAAEAAAQQLAAAGIRGVGAEVWRRPWAELGPAHQYSLDLAPKVLYGAGPLIQLLLGSGAHHYLEFKLVQGSYILDASAGSGTAGAAPQLRSVPSSRSEVFKNRQLSPLQKRVLMRFLKAAAEALDGEGPLKDAFGTQPISALLAQQGLDLQLQQSLVHGVLLADACCSTASGGDGGASSSAGAGAAGGGGGGQPAELTAAAALERLRLYVQSAGRYGPDTGPFLTPLYGCGELPQAFCRSAAVAGAVQVLRCGIQGLSFDEHTFCCDRVELASGQAIRCGQLAASGAALQEWLAAFRPATRTRNTHRCCAVLDGAPVPGEQQSMAAVLLPAAQGAMRALALSSSTAVCPPGKHLLYLWADAGEGDGSGDGSGSEAPQPGPAADALLPALSCLADTSALQRPSVSGSSGAASSGGLAQEAGSGGGGSGKPAVLWSAFYTQSSAERLPAGDGGGGRWPANVALCPGPDASATFASAVEAAKRCYWQLFPPASEGAAVEGGTAGEGGAAEPPFPLDQQARQQRQRSEEADGAGGAAPAGDVDSDDEAVAALQAALRQVAASDEAGEAQQQGPGQEEGDAHAAAE